MPNAHRAIFLKQSGELLDGSDSNGHWQAAQKNAINLAEAYKQLKNLAIDGLTVVPGAGNIARGDNLRRQGIAEGYADVIGRWGTIGNALVLAASLEALQVPVQLFISDKLSYTDQSIPEKLQTYSADGLLKAHQAGKIAIIAGGSGEDHMTTDNAVAFYARAYRTVYSGQITVLKSTKFDGVFESDPATSSSLPRRYAKISVQTIRDNYQQLKVIDEGSLDQLINGDLSMIIYSDQSHSLTDVITAPEGTLGTLVVPHPTDPILA